jgi:hypothetical protein
MYLASDVSDRTQREHPGMLSFEELVNFRGGSGSGVTSGTCGLRKSNGETHCSMSRQEAEGWANHYGSGNYWCCDSCASNGGSASYC